MRYFWSVLCVCSLQLACAATDTAVTVNALYAPMYDGSAIVQSTVKSAVIVLLLLAFWVYWNKVILPGLHGGVVQNRNLQIIEKLQVDPTTAVYVLKIGDSYETVITSSRQLARLGTIPAKAIRLDKKKPVPPVDFAALLKQIKKSKLLKR